MSPNAPSSVPVGSTVPRPFTAQVVTDLVQGGKKRVHGGAGSASDADGGAGLGGEMSESGKTKKLKLNPPPVSTSPGATPQGSRAGSPASLANRGFSSRASSPEGGSSVRGRFHLLSSVNQTWTPVGRSYATMYADATLWIQAKLEYLLLDLAVKVSPRRLISMLPFRRLVFSVAIC